MAETRASEIQRFLDDIKEQMRKDGMSEEDILALDVGSSHPYTCKCDACKRWWELVGPEE